MKSLRLLAKLNLVDVIDDYIFFGENKINTKIHEYYTCTILLSVYNILL